jgi:hypothetical protein
MIYEDTAIRNLIVEGRECPGSECNGDISPIEYGIGYVQSFSTQFGVK